MTSRIKSKGIVKYIWAATWQNQQYGLCAHRRLKVSPGIHPVWSESSLSAWRKLGSLATHWAHSEDSDQTGQMPRLIWVFAGCTVILLVLSWGGSYIYSGQPFTPSPQKLSIQTQLSYLLFLSKHTHFQLFIVAARSDLCTIIIRATPNVHTCI